MKNLYDRMDKIVELNGRIGLECGENLLFVEFNGYENEKMQFRVTGDDTDFTGETQKLDKGDHVGIAVLAKVFETIKDAEKIITPNSVKYDIDKWFTDIEVVRETNYVNKPSTNNTDYNFPKMWGVIQERVNDEADPLTKQEADQMRSDWFTTQRVLWQLKLQKDAGMWDQWDDEKLEDGVSFMEAWSSVNSNSYEYK